MKKLPLLGLASCLAFGLVSATPSTAQTVSTSYPTSAASANLPAAGDIIERYVRACGGREAFERLQSRVAAGTVEVPVHGLRGTFTMYAMAPNFNSTISVFPQYGILKEGFDGELAWEQTPALGIREKRGADLESARRDADFYREIHLGLLYRSLQVTGVQRLGTQEAYVIAATLPDGTQDQLFFDTLSGLLVRMDMVRNSAKGQRIPMQALYDDYRDVDGIKMPFVVRQSTPNYVAIFRYSSIRHNVSLEDSLFLKPLR